MKFFRSHFIFITYCFFVIFATAFQSSFWNMFFPNIPGPVLWLAPLVYFAVHKNYFPGLLQSYFLGILVSQFSNVPLKLIWTPILIFFSIVYIIRDRFYWRGTGYLAAMTFLSTTVFHITYIALSYSVEKQHSSPLVMDRLVQCVLTPVFTLPIYFLFEKLEALAVDHTYDSTETSTASEVES